ncbi:Protein CANDIDATE G-PROTEIN COUPLED RECEPTOR 7 [Linum perenne]
METFMFVSIKKKKKTTRTFQSTTKKQIKKINQSIRMLLTNKNTIAVPNRLLHAVVFLLTIPICSSEIKNTHIVGDSRSLILFEQFGFSGDGHVDISINNLSYESQRSPKSNLNLSNLAFFLIKDISTILNDSTAASAAASTARAASSSPCVLSSKFVQIIFRFNNSHNGSISVSEPGSYNLMFGNCQPEFEISMRVHTEMYTFLHGGGGGEQKLVKFYLPVGQAALPYIYLGFFSIYAASFLSWSILICYRSQRCSKIHVVMAALLLVKAMKLVCAAEDKIHVARSGTPHGWDVAFYVFGFIKGTMMFTVIVLIGTGWSFLKPYLQEREKSVLMVVVPLQTGPATKDWVAWNEIFLLMDVLCCFAVFMPIVWSIRSLREASKSDGKAARNLEKLSLFRQFYIVVVGYLYFTRVVAPAIGSTVSYRFEWVRVVLGEVGSLVFYGFVFYNFQPMDKTNPYLGVDDDRVGSQLLGDDDRSF